MVNFVPFRKYKQFNLVNMGQMPPVTKSWGSNAECGKDYKQEREMQIMQVLGESRK